MLRWVLLAFAIAVRCVNGLPPSSDFVYLFGMETKMNHSIVRDLACMAGEYVSDFSHRGPAGLPAAAECAVLLKRWKSVDDIATIPKSKNGEYIGGPHS